MPNNGRVTLSSDIVTSEHIRTVMEQYYSSNPYAPIPLQYNSTGAITFNSDSSTSSYSGVIKHIKNLEQYKQLSPFQEWELKNVLTDK